MNKIYFATTNQGKINEAKQILGIEIEGTGLNIDEIQSLDPIEVAVKKATTYYAKLKQPILVEDVSLTFKALGRLPGTYINDFSKELGNEGLIKLLENASTRKATAQTTLVFYDGDGCEHVFIGTIKGNISKRPEGDKGFGWDPIFIPDGQTKTFAQMDEGEKNKYSMRFLALEKFREWLNNQ